jgi:hypothetical protein
MTSRSDADRDGLLYMADVKLNFQQTLMNIDWMRLHENAIKAILPKQWTHIDELNVTSIGVRLRNLGIEWDSAGELNGILFYLEAIGMIERNWRKVRGNPESLFTLH